MSPVYESDESFLLVVTIPKGGYYIATPLYFHSDEQMLTVLNGSVQVTLVSSLHSEKLPDDENQLFLISRSKEGIEIISFFLCL